MRKFLKNISLSGGFTLIELLVIISIIGVLSSIVLASLNTSRVKARDTKRIADLRTIRNALELYYNTKGHYPPAGAEFYVISNSTSWIPGLVPAYAPQLPVHSGGSQYFYFTPIIATPGVYDLITFFESTDNPYRCGLKHYISDSHTYHNGSKVYWCDPSPSVAINYEDLYSIK